MKIQTFALIGTCLLLNACAPAGDNITTTTGGGGAIVIGSGGGGSGSAVTTGGEPMLAPQAMAAQFDPATETREWHAATSVFQCRDIEKTLKDQGLKIRLVESKRTNDPMLPFACIFEGEDADPNAERFLTPQHNNH